jgi:hypothetical protein
MTFRFLLIISVLLACSSATMQQNSVEKIDTPEYSKIMMEYSTELSELGLTKFASNKNQFWDISDYDVSQIDGNLKTIIHNYLQDSFSTGYDTLFKINNVFRQYAGINGVDNERLVLIRFYNKAKIKTRYGEYYPDTLRIHRAPYFHFYPDFYFLLYSVKENKAIYMKW